MPDPRKPKRSGIQLEPGTLLAGRFSIVRRVGGGGMGSVYQARDTRLADRLCAVKEMIEMFADPTQREKAVDDFKREAAVLAQLEHPSIPTIYDHFIENNKYYLVMRWIGGGDLSQQMQVRGGTVDEATVTKWSIQCCDVLHYIHSQQPPIIYRDLKPANLMLDDKTGRIMLVDFGIARIVRPTEKGVTAIGTMGYAPPELFAGKAEPRTDIYSLGATMFHMLTGADPQDNPLLIFDFSKFPTPRKINPKISEGMEKILMRTVAHEVTDRPDSALQLMRDLQEHSNLLAKGKESSALPPKPGDKVIGDKTGEEAAGQSVFCGNCGEKIGVDDVFCAHCGYRQPEGLRRGGVEAPRVTAQIVILGTGEHKPYVIEKESILLGRTDPHTGIFPEIDLTMYDPETKVSRRHARIYRSGEQFLIEDLGSVNGTVVMPVNGGSIRLNTKSPRVLSAGDEVKLGGTHMKFMMI